MITISKLGPDLRERYRELGVIEGYNKWSTTYDSEHNPLIALEEKTTLELIGDATGKRALDLGCGTGRYCVLLADRGATVFGVDPSPDMLELARRKVTSSCRFYLFQGTGEALDFPDDHFDLVVSALTLCHIPDIAPAFHEMARVLRQNGLLIISDIHPYWPASGHNYTEFYDESGQEYRILEYTHLFEEYWRLCAKHGLVFEDIREEKIDAELVEDFPNLDYLLGVPLAMHLKLRKLTHA